MKSSIVLVVALAACTETTGSASQSASSSQVTCIELCGAPICPNPTGGYARCYSVYPLCSEVGCSESAFCNPSTNICLCVVAEGGPFVTCAWLYPSCAPLECDELICPIPESTSCLCDHEEGPSVACTGL